MFNQTLLSVLLAMSILACAGEDTTAPDIQCAAGTTLNTAGDTCELNLAEGVSVSASGEIVADTANTDTEAALAAARAEGRAEGLEEGAASVDITTDNQAAFDEGAASVDITTDNQAAREEGRAAGVVEGAASVTPLNCAEGTAVNAAGDACEPTVDYRAAAVEEGRLAGVASVDITTDNQEAYDEGAASVTPLNCAEGTAVNAAGDACEPTVEYRAAAVEEGRAAGVVEGAASVTPLNCAAGTVENEAGDACQPNLSVDVAVRDIQTCVETCQYSGDGACDDGGQNSDFNVCAYGSDCQDCGVRFDNSIAPTADYRTTAVEEGRVAGAASVTPLTCDLGTGENDAGDACEPTLSVDVAIGDEDTIVPTDAYAAQVCANGGGTFDAETGACAPTYDCFRGGFCAESAANGWFTAQDGNRYAGDTLVSSGCADNDWPAETLWIEGAFHGSDETTNYSGEGMTMMAILCWAN